VPSVRGVFVWLVILGAAWPVSAAPPIVAAVTTQSAVLSNSLPTTFGLPTIDAWGGNTYAILTGGQTAAFVRPSGSSTLSRLIQAGDAVPGVPSSRVDVILGLKAGSNGTVALLLDYLSGDTTKNALITYAGTTPTVVALSTDVAPGGLGTIFGRTMSLVGVNASGAVAFTAPLTPLAGVFNPAPVTTIFVAPSGASPVRIVGQGDSLPPPSGATYSSITALAFNDLGEVLFRASISGGSGGNGLFVGSASGVRKIAATGDSNLVSGNFSSSSLSSGPARLNNLGQVAFADSGRLYLSRPGQALSVLVTATTTAPAPLNAQTVSSISSLAAFNDSGTVLFVAGLTGSNQAVLQYASGSSSLTMPVYRGQTIPGSASVTFSGFQSVGMNNAGDIAFYASVTPVVSSFTGGVFKVPAGGSLALLVQDSSSIPGGVATFKTANYCEMLASGTVYVESTLNNGLPTAGSFRVVGTTVETLLLDTQEMPAGAPVTIRNLFPRGGGHYLGFVARRAGGHMGLFVHHVPSGVTSKVLVDGEYFAPPGTVTNVSGTLVPVGGNGMVVFAATPSWTTSQILYAWTPNDGAMKLAAPGDTVPGTALTFWTTTLASSLLPPMNASNVVLFKGTYSGGTGLFVGVPGQALALAVKSGDTAPGGGTFTTSSFGTFLLNDAGQVAFSAATTTVANGIYVATPGSAAGKVAAVGDSAPGGSPFASFASPGPAAFDAQGNVLFFATLASGASGLFMGKAGAAVQAVAVNGGSVTSGGVFAFTNASRDARINPMGDVLFQAPLLGGSADSGLFLRRGSTGVIEAVAFQGQLAPGLSARFTTIEPTINSLPGEFNELGPGGEVWFENRLDLGDHTAQGVFRYDLDRTLSTVLVRGQAPPDGSGGTVLAVSQGVGAGAAGRFYARVNTLGGSATEAILTTKIATRGDLTGDGLPDLALFRPSTGTWHIKGAPSVALGAAGDIPVPADYNGDGVNELAVFSRVSVTWTIQGMAPFQFGGSGDIPVPADYDGDHSADVTVFRPATGEWITRNGPTVSLGAAGDIPVPADYNGDGRAERAVFRPSTGTWFVEGRDPVVFGAAGDIPMAFPLASGAFTFAYFRPSTGVWAAYGQGTVSFGLAGDIPMVADVTSSGQPALVIYRQGTGTWGLFDIAAGAAQPTQAFGTAGDLPAWQAPAAWFGAAPIFNTVFHDALHRPFPNGTALEDSVVHPVFTATGLYGVPSGSMSYRYYLGSNCVDSPSSAFAVSLDGSGVGHVSAATNLGSTGLSVLASYSGDGNYASTTVCAPLSTRSDLPFADVLIPESTVVKAAHVAELRSAIDTIRLEHGLPLFAWTDAALAPRATVVKRAHLADLRRALEDIYTATARPLPAWSEPLLTAGVTTIKTSQLSEIRFRLTQDW
jgi:hypothetical protein